MVKVLKAKQKLQQQQQQEMKMKWITHKWLVIRNGWMYAMKEVDERNLWRITLKNKREIYEKFQFV